MPLLNWVNDTRARSAASEVPFHLLKKISSYGDKSEAKKNLLIQGDNLLALKALLLDFSHYFRWLFANFRECSLIS